MHTSIHRVDRADANGKLTSMISQWLRSDLKASWERVADALNRIPDYGPATAARFRRAAGLAGEKWSMCFSFVCAVATRILTQLKHLYNVM